MRIDRPVSCFLLLCLLIGMSSVQAQSTAADPIDFNRDVRPILMSHCTSCHGGVKQAGDVSFVYADRVLPPDGWIVEPGDPDASVLIERIKTDDPDTRMPPPDEHPEPLSADEIATLEQWISQGAAWGDLWSMAPLANNTQRFDTTSDWPRQSLDRLVLETLREQGLQTSADASPSQWLRRASLDLIGLPPTIEQLDSFATDCAAADSDASVERRYAAEVDRLLASQNFGQRWASMWMDLARYADSRGFEKDPHRDMWPYRDWLIKAFNDDMPYDEFTIKQLAGDLLPDPTADDLIATAFHRNTQTNTEGGTDDEEFRVAAIIDRVNTTWTVWQATTFGCVQCHSHPYDAFEHDEYYRCMALFDNSLDTDLDDDYPTLKIPSERSLIEAAIADQRQLEIIRHQRNDLGRSFAESVAWDAMAPTDVSSTDGELEVDGNHVRTASGTFPVGVEYTVDFSVDTDDPITAFRIEILPTANDPTTGPEKGAVLTQLKAEWIADDDTQTPIKFSDAFVDAITGPSDPRDALKGNGNGVGEFPKLTSARWAVFVLKEPASRPDGASLRLTMAQKASTSGNNATPIRNFTWSLCTDAQWAERMATDEWTSIDDALKQSQAKVNAIEGSSLPVMVARPDMARRTTRTFTRGNWMDRGDEVEPGIPHVFDKPGAEATIDNRLAFAQWLVSDANPISARVWANRIWSQLFGRGLVETEEDFGSSGLPPSDSRLLDHLAMRLRSDHDWHLKPFLRDLVLSSTYRQTNQVSTDKHAKDPTNRYHGRGPRTRLSAEMVRDQALLVSGLINDQVGGPSVMPPQPDGVWQTIYSGATWETATGDQRYRRALYTYWRRTSPYPSFLTFDSPTRDLCSPRRIDTNTPLQALVTLNDPVYQECSHALADRVTDDCQGSVEHAIQRMYLAATSQMPTDLESGELMSLYEDLVHSSTNPSDTSSAMSIVANTILNLDKALTK
ncbi:Planctomycete cytochrome C [Rubripirellula tenax]|uniref:Planctomycete cytochrome C n=1 Tax=Rubripirellula tenax TaxID=2528015 RepID=A0A5C6ES72_9BACT|nr:PSD1 and planctomycete cytochrome C domain-containing protein [Rubripirellula tenax]TWU50947.1 Planctomycete cytochrome C [Rubripirellula tenax]